MNLTKKHQEIIQLIADEEVWDLASFIRYIYKDKINSYDVEEIRKNKLQDYYSKRDEIDKYADFFRDKEYLDLKSIVQSSSTITSKKYSEADIENLKRHLHDYSFNDNSFIKEVKLLGKVFSVDTLTEPVYLIEDDTPILDFLYIWDMLADDDLIIIKTRPLTKEDAKLFFKKGKKEDNIDKIKKSIVPNPSPFIEKYVGYSMDKRRIYKSRDIEYADSEVIPNEEVILKSQEYLDKQIIVTHRIKSFVERKFISFEEHSLKIQTFLTICAIILSVVLSAISICVSFKVSRDDTIFWHENLQKEYKLTDTQIEILSSVLDKLEEISTSTQKQRTNNIDFSTELEKIKSDTDTIIKKLENVVLIKSKDQKNR